MSKTLAQAEGRKKPVFADYLEHARIKISFLPEDYHLLSVLKIIRNERSSSIRRP